MSREKLPQPLPDEKDAAMAQPPAQETAAGNPAVAGNPATTDNSVATGAPKETVTTRQKGKKTEYRRTPKEKRPQKPAREREGGGIVSHINPQQPPENPNPDDIKEPFRPPKE